MGRKPNPCRSVDHLWTVTKLAAGGSSHGLSIHDDRSVYYRTRSFSSRAVEREITVHTDIEIPPLNRGEHAWYHGDETLDTIVSKRDIVFEFPRKELLAREQQPFQNSIKLTKRKQA